uniref:ZAD domain-containing protein n=1 Tax=Stomoxys calcitrans TaxID=35570 RepID=A0A1I8PJ95_STOCA
MNCELCIIPLRRTKSYSIYDEFFDDKHRLVDVIEKYLQMQLKSTESQSSFLCQSCYTHLDDFHKFALLVKEKQESLNDIPTIKLEDSDDEEHEIGYIRDTDVLVEFKTDGDMQDDDAADMQEDLLIPAAGYANGTDYYNDSRSGFEYNSSWLTGNDRMFKSKNCFPKTPVRKTPYKTHTPEDRSRIVDAANRGDDWSALASRLGVKYKTAYTWVSTSRKEMFLKSGKTSFTEDEIQTIIQWIEENRQMTLKEIVAKVKSHLKKDVCVYFVEGTLEGRLYQHRRSQDYHPHLMNTIENKMKRSEYVKTLKYYMDLKKSIIWLGEANFKMFCRRAKGRFNTNSTIYATCDPTIYMMGAISHDGVLDLKRSRTRIRPEEIFKEWMETKRDNITNFVIVCDSDYCFSELDEYFNNSDVTLLLLSPYSCTLNPLEIIWENIKTNIKSQSNISHFIPNDLKEQRLLVAEKCIDDMLPNITVDDCQNAIRNANKRNKDIMDMLDMPVY